jgi:hypothetical protein
VKLTQGLERIRSGDKQQHQQAAVAQGQNSSQPAKRGPIVWMQMLFLVRRRFCIPLLGVHSLNKARLFAQAQMRVPLGVIRMFVGGVQNATIWSSMLPGNR